MLSSSRGVKSAILSADFFFPLFLVKRLKCVGDGKARGAVSRVPRLLWETHCSDPFKTAEELEARRTNCAQRSGERTRFNFGLLRQPKRKGGKKI